MPTATPLKGKRVAVAGGRRFDDIAKIIEKQGGAARLRPMMGLSSNDKPQVSEAISELVQKGTDWLVVVTGVGTRALVNKAAELGFETELAEILTNAQVAARGYKTLKALKDLDVTPAAVDDDGTVGGLRRELEPFDFASKRVTLQLHGERMPELSDWLESRGASVLEIPLYFYDPPAQPDLQTLLFEVVSAEVDAVAFTSNTQVKFLFAGAAALGAEDYLRRAFNERVVALSVGHVTSQSLSEHGVTRIIAPEHERMGAMVMALGACYSTANSASSLPVTLTGVKTALVVGGGLVATRKAGSLLEAGIIPKVVSPDLTPELTGLLAAGRLEHQPRSYEASDLTDIQLVFAATSDAATNAQIAADARAKNILCNVADTPELSTFTSLATVRRGELSVSVATGGASPSLSAYLREKLESQFPAGYAVLVDVLKKERSSLATLNSEQRRYVLDELTQTKSLQRLEDLTLEEASQFVTHILTTQTQPASSPSAARSL